MDIAEVLNRIRPNTSWKIKDTYESLVWLDENSTKPSYEEIETHWKSIEKEILEERARELRQSAYQAEADPLFFKWQAGEGTQEEWIEKRKEIRQRYPKE